MTPGDPAVLEDMVKQAFGWLHASRIEFIRYQDVVALAHKPWCGIDRLLHERYAKHLAACRSDDGALLRCSISSLYQGAHSQSLWSRLVHVPAQITITCALSEAVRLLLFYGTYFKNLERSELGELETMLMLYENGFMPVGLSPTGVLYVITG
jgi:hypothetical protein